MEMVDALYLLKPMPLLSPHAFNHSEQSKYINKSYSLQLTFHF